MRTLFSENILSPSPTPVSKPNPFELLFASNPSTALTVSPATSTHSSPGQYGWLTQRSQDQHHQLPRSRAADTEASDSSSYAADGGQRSQYAARRKGNPMLLFMGLRRSGKSSIQKVVFQKLSPADTLFLEPTTRLETVRLQSFIPFDSIEIPSHLHLFTTPPASPSLAAADIDVDPTLHGLFNAAGAVIWVLDAQDEVLPSIAALVQLAVFLARRHPRAHLAVFIHKTDGLGAEYKDDTFRDIRQRVHDELSDLGHGSQPVAYHQTSIFDASIFEAVSKVAQALLLPPPRLAAVEGLMNRLCSTCGVQKAYLFETGTKLYIATDASPTFVRDYEVCADYVDVVVDLKQIYGWRRSLGRDDRTDRKEADDVEGDEEGEEEDVMSLGESIVTYDRGGDTYIYAKEINEYLSLICVMGKGSSAEKRVRIDYNAGILHDALVKVFQI